MRLRTSSPTSPPNRRPAVPESGLCYNGDVMERDERSGLAELAAAVLLVVAVLGLTMGARWVGVYRAHPARARAGAGAVQAAIPPERNFPLPVVIGHGIFAVTTLILVLLTVLKISGSLPTRPRQQRPGSLLPLPA